MTNYVAWIALAVSVISAVIAWRAKEQAKKAATLEPRTKAINHLYEAHFDATNNGYVTSKTVNSIHEARKIAARVFSREIRTELDRAHAIATELNVPNPSQWLPRTVEFGKTLGTLIERMNDEARLG